MYRIRIFSSFCDSANCKSVYERLCETDQMDNYGPDKDIYIVGDDEPFTHAIIMNTAMPQLDISKNNVVGLAFEPPQFLLSSNSNSFIEYVKKNVSKYFIGVSQGLPHEFIEKYSYMWHITPPRVIPQKDKLCSIMVSDKTQSPGHRYRHDLVNYILQSNLPIDIYGRGCDFYVNDKRINKRLKGLFTDNEPYESYYFHIAIENFQTNTYVSEKYTNAILWNTVPIYLGAANTPFPNLTITLSGDASQDMNTIKTILENPNNYMKDFSQNEVREKLNLLKNLDTIFSE